jgi:hypothetical protein
MPTVQLCVVNLPIFVVFLARLRRFPNTLQAFMADVAAADAKISEYPAIDVKLPDQPPVSTTDGDAATAVELYDQVPCSSADEEPATAVVFPDQPPICTTDGVAVTAVELYDQVPCSSTDGESSTDEEPATVVQFPDQPPVSTTDGVAATTVELSDQVPVSTADGEPSAAAALFLTTTATAITGELDLEVDSEIESMFSSDDSVLDEDYDPTGLDTDGSTDSHNSNMSDVSMVPASCEG